MNVLKTAWGSVLSSTVLVLALLPAGCSQSGSTRNDDSGKDEVSIGYGTQPKEESTSSVEKIDADDHRHPMTRAEEMLEGVPGVQLLRAPGGGIWVRIRGVNSIYGSNEPLYVVDGMPVQVNPGQGLSWLNPRDIATIEVLKDASSTAIYGSRGANGVVIITTKR
jgi:iron complex outermembrane receptor protein